MGKVRGQLSVVREATETVVGFVDGRLIDTDVINAVNKQILDIVEGSNGLRLILDFTDVTYVSSTFLGSLVRVNKRIKEAGGKLLLCGMADDIRKLFQITGLDRIVPILPTTAEAKAAND